jgi:hypothetical protein
VTRPPTPQGPWRGVLLSGLVFPGLGQLRSGHPWRALVFGGSSAVLLVAVARRVMAETQRLMPEDPAAILDPALPFRLAMEIHRDNATFFFWATLWIVAIWVASMVDAWACGRSPRP